jgi:hypothetical protein
MTTMKQEYENIVIALQREEKRNNSLTQEIIESRSQLSTLKVSRFTTVVTEIEVAYLDLSFVTYIFI